MDDGGLTALQRRALAVFGWNNCYRIGSTIEGSWDGWGGGFNRYTIVDSRENYGYIMVSRGRGLHCTKGEVELLCTLVMGENVSFFPE